MYIYNIIKKSIILMIKLAKYYTIINLYSIYLKIKFV